MALGLGGGYGMFAVMAGRYLYPAHSAEKRWLFVGTLQSIEAGASIAFEAPGGQRVAVTRLGNRATVDDFIALSSICPHLGCQVHWEVQNDRFFCPCHNGAFDKEGNATAGPPHDAGQKLSRFPLKIENGLLYIEVAVA